MALLGHTKLSIPKLPFVLALVLSIPIFSLLYFFTSAKNSSISFSQAESEGLTQIKALYQGNTDFSSAQQVLDFTHEVTKIADISNLILDPELESIYLILAFSQDIPKFFQDLSLQQSTQLKLRKADLFEKIQKASTYISKSPVAQLPQVSELTAKIQNSYSILENSQSVFESTKQLKLIAESMLELTDIIITTRISKEIHSRNSALVFSFSLWIVGLLMAIFISLNGQQLAKQKNIVEEVAIRNSKLAELGTLSAQIAHEINNPLSIIKGKAALLGKILDSNPASIDQVKKGLAQIEKTSDRISKIIKGLKTTTRNSESDEFIKVSLKSIFDDIEALYFDKVTKAQVQLTLPSESALSSIWINCRPAEISQVFLNLISNGVDAIAGSQNPWIKIVFLDQGPTMKLQFIDSGNGIPPEIAQKLMQPFFTTKSVGKGTGLGLSISKKIVESHGGKLSLNSSISNTCFEIEIPFEKNTPAEVAA